MLTSSKRPIRVPLRFRVPQCLHEISLDEAPAERLRQTDRACAEVMPDVTESQRQHLALSQELVVESLRHDGAVYLAACLARSERHPSRLSTAQFAILVKDAELHGTQPLRELADGLRLPGQPREVIFHDYPSGEAVVVGEELAVCTPLTALGRPVSQVHRVRQAQVIFAFPNNRRLAILNLTSEHLDDWEHYVAMLNRIAHSVSFTESDTSRITDRLSGLT